MGTSTKKYLPYLLLLLLSVPLYFIDIADLHAWGDDFAQYIKEAQNIGHGRPFYLSNYIFNKYNTNYAPPQYPPGFPLLLAPVIKNWGLSFRAMYYFNSFLATCLLFVLFAYFRKYAGIVASVCLAVLVCYSGRVIDLKGNVLADIPCLIFVTLYLWQRNMEQHSRRSIALLILFAVLAIQMRSQAFFLIVAEGIFLLLVFIKTSVQEKKIVVRKTLFLSLYIIAGVVTVNLFLNKVIFYSPLSTTDFYKNIIDEVLSKDLINVAEGSMTYLLKTISAFFYFKTYDGFSKAAVFFITSIGLTFGITGFIVNISKRLALDDIFFAVMCVVILFFPGRDERYFLPAVPILFYYCYTTFKIILPAITSVKGRGIAIIITLIYLVSGFGYFEKSSAELSYGGIPKHNDLVALQYISEHVADSDIVAFSKPRMLTLFTNKRSMNISWQISLDMNKKVFDSMHVKYMLVLDGIDDGYFKEYLREVQRPVDSIRISEGYILYSLRH